MDPKAFVSYVRSVHLHKDKEVFKVHELPVGEFAKSMGLPGTPKVKLLSRERTNGRKNAPRTASDESESAESSGEEHEGEELSSKVCYTSSSDSIIVYLLGNMVAFRSYEI